MRTGHPDLGRERTQQKTEPIGTSGLVTAVTAAISALGIFIDSRLDQRAYQNALGAEPIGETVLTDFQFAPNFNSGEVWRLTGVVDFSADYGQIEQWRPGQAQPSPPTHPGIDHGPEGGPAVFLAYGVRLYFHEPHGLVGEHQIAVTCRIEGHSTVSWAEYRILDACRDLEVTDS